LVAKAAPDGYTLLYVSNTVVMNPYLYEKLPFDVQKDLQPVGLLVTAPILVLVNPSAAIQSIGDLLKQGKERPGQLSYATPGNGTPHHFAMELLKARSGANLLHVPYKGAAPAVTDVLGGHVPVLVATPSSVVDFISSGRLRLLATMEPARTSAFPNVPAIAEIVPDFEVSIWHGLMLPANPPAEVVETLSAAAKRIVAEPEFRKKLAPTGFAPKYEPPQTMKERIVADLKTWKKVAEDAGIVAE
jgi:tripartite-type tricarboxylate transporter receptor subunit TctC